MSKDAITNVNAQLWLKLVRGVKTNRMLDCIKKRIISRDKEVITLPYSAFVRLHLKFSLQIRSLLCKKSCRQARGGPDRGHKDDERTQKSDMWGKAERTGLFSLDKRRLSGDFITMFQYFKGGSKEDRDSLFSQVVTKRQGVMETSYSWGDSGWTGE